jgi:D-glycero-alpha-D-manno-heptose-7-phosphate kinase
MIISQTPLRISFAGGGTDLSKFWRKEEGKVLASTIDKYIYVIIKKRFGDEIVLNYTKRETVNTVLELKHDLVREALLMTGIKSGVEIWTPADIPSSGSGLGSSSTLTVGLLNAFYTFQGTQVTAEQLAQESCNIEIDILGKPIGKQDQYIAAYGGINALTFNPDKSVTVDAIKASNHSFRVFGSNLLLFYTGITRESSSILTKQKSVTNNKREILTQMRDQVPVIQKLIVNETSFNNIGLILDKTWKLKKQISKKISNPIIDEMYQKALDSGALGGKISGAGGGGFLLLYVPRENQNSVRKALENYREFPFMLEPDGSKIIFNIKRDYWK